MSAIAMKHFDALAYVKTAKSLGVNEELATFQARELEAISESNQDIMQSKLEKELTKVATKADLNELRVATKADLSELRVATKADLNELSMATKADLNELRVATRADLNELSMATKADLNELRVATKADLNNGLKDLELRMNDKVDRSTNKLITVISFVIAIATFIIKFH